MIPSSTRDAICAPPPHILNDVLVSAQATDPTAAPSLGCGRAPSLGGASRSQGGPTRVCARGLRVGRLVRVAAFALLSALLFLGVFAEQASAQSTTVQFGRGNYNVREGQTLQPTLSLSAGSSNPVTFSVTASGGTATSGTDYAAGPFSVTVPANTTSHPFDVAIETDTNIEDYETFTLTISSPPQGFTLGSRSTATVQIVNVSLVNPNWHFKPSGLNTGDQFRLLFKTENERNGASANIGDYDTFVRNRISGSSTGHADIRSYATTFRVVGSTATVNAAWHTATGIMESNSPSHTPWSTPIYWLGGGKIADDHNDFWDGTWDNTGLGDANERNANGVATTQKRGPNTGTKTGTTHATAGVKHSNHLGATNVQWGNANTGANPISQGNHAKTSNNVYMGLSGVFEVAPVPAGVLWAETPYAWMAEGGETSRLEFYHNNTGALQEDVVVHFTMTGTATPGVDYTISSGSGADGLTVTTDYAAGTGTFTLPAQLVKFTRRAMDLTVLSDEVRDNAETVVLTLVPGTGYTLHNDPTLHTMTMTLYEDTGHATFSIKGIPAVAETLTITQDTSDPDGYGLIDFYYYYFQDEPVDAVEDGVIDSHPSRMSFSGSASSNRFVVRAEDVGKYYMAAVTYYDGNGFIHNPGTATVGPVKAAVGFSSPTYRAPEGETLRPTLELTPTSSSAQTFTVTASGGSATAGTDYEAGPFTVTVPANTARHSFDINIPVDAAAESGESFTLAISSVPPDYLAGTQGTATVVIEDVVSVSNDWSLVPSGLTTAGSKFRLLAAPTTKFAASSTNIATYDQNVQGALGSGHADIQRFGAQFRALVSTPTVDARDHTGTTGAGEAIYWLGGPKVADDYADFYDEDWDDTSQTGRDEDGNSIRLNSCGLTGGGIGAFSIWTGSENDGTGDSGKELGTANPRIGDLCNAVLNTSGSGPFKYNNSNGRRPKTDTRHLYALSPVFQVSGCTGDNTGVMISAGTSPVTEGMNAEFTVELCPAPVSPVTVNLQVSQEEFSDWLRSSDAGRQTVTVGASGMATYAVPTKNNAQWDGGTGHVTVELLEGDYRLLLQSHVAEVEITDDESAPSSPIVIISGSPTVTEGGSASVTVEARPAPSSALTVNLTVSETGAGDFVAASDEGQKMVTIPAASGDASSSASHIILLQNDTDDDLGGSLRVDLAAGTGYERGPVQSRTVTMEVEDDDATTVTLTSASSSTVAEGERATFAVELGRRLVAGERMEIRFRLTGSAEYGESLSSDYELSTSSAPGVTFDPNAVILEIVGPSAPRSVTMTISAHTDILSEPAETISVGVGNLDSNLDGGASSTGSLEFTLSEVDPVPQVSLRWGSPLPGGTFESTGAWFLLDVIPGPVQDLDVNVRVVEQGGADFIAASEEGMRQVTIPAANTSSFATFNVLATQKDAVQPEGSLVVTILPGEGYVVTGAASITTKVRDDTDTTPRVSFYPSSSSVDEGVGSQDVLVDITPSSSESFVLQYSLSGTATLDSDYSISGGGGPTRAVRVEAGKTSLTIPVRLVDDALSEGVETVVFTLKSGSDYTLESPWRTHTLLIDASDGGTGGPVGPIGPVTPVASFASASQSAGEGSGTRNVAVNLRPAPSGAVTLEYAVSGTATAGSDYSITGSGRVQVAAGQSSANIPVTITDDSANEQAETVILTLSDSADYDLGNPRVHTLTITDNDGGGGGDGGGGDGGGGDDNNNNNDDSLVTLSVSPNPVREGEALTVTVSLSQTVPSAITVPIVLTAGTAEAEDYGALASIVVDANEPNGESTLSTVVDDDRDDETFMVSLGALPAGFSRGAQASVDVTVTDVTDVTSAESFGDEIPEVFALDQNYPNPFNPVTTIAFALPETQHVRLAVYDLLGQQVRVLLDGILPAARYRIPFDASALASGSYLYVLRTEKETAVKSMVLLK